MGRVTTGVLEIEVDDGGPREGPPVLLLHGWPDAPRGWRPVAERLRADGWRTIIPALRGSAGTRFLAAGTPRDGRGVALASDAFDLLDALGLERVAVVGHDWGARAAYTMAVLAPERCAGVAGLALPYQPRGVFAIPPYDQARAFWYQWLMCFGAGAEAVAADPVGFARVQWDTWSPPGWFDDAEFAATARTFANPDWVAITLNAYRTRFLPDEPRDPRYADLARRLSETERITVPTLMIQGGDDRCDHPAGSAGLDPYFTAAYERLVLDGVGHFPHREAPEPVADAILRHLAQTAAR
ncbi:MAG TPA: alpha/beta hydrolase [Streptosporangiaceae bacterium]|jgi:pimeloyl-ACP methyl ester carboxylesterase